MSPPSVCVGRVGAGPSRYAAPTLRYGPAGDSAPRLRLRRLVWPKAGFRLRSALPGPKPSSAPPRTNFLHKAVGKGLGPLEFCA